MPWLYPDRLWRTWWQEFLDRMGWPNQRGRAPNDSDGIHQGYPAAIRLAVLCGFMAPMLITLLLWSGYCAGSRSARKSAVRAAYAVWPSDGRSFVANIAYSLFSLKESNTSSFRSVKPDCFFCLMGAVDGAFALSGMSSSYLGLRNVDGWVCFKSINL